MSSTEEGSGRSVGVHYRGDLRRALIDAAVAVLNETGIDSLSLRSVARRIGVSNAAPAHHFGDKAGILTAVATEGFELFIDHLASALAAATDDPLDQLPSLGCAYAEFAEQNPGTFSVMFQPAVTRLDDPALQSASNAAFDALRHHIEQCQQRGWHREADTQILAAAAWALAHGISVLRNQGSLQRHLPDASLECVATMVSTLTADHRDFQQSAR